MPKSTSPSAPTPLANGFAMPAEWTPHEATWLAWPHNPTDWPGKLAPLQWVYAEIVKKLAAGEKVRICVADAKREHHVRRILKEADALSDAVEFFRFPTDRSWMRDNGPIFLAKGRGRNAELAIADFQFTSWSRYRNWQKDNAIPSRIARSLKLSRYEAKLGGKPFVLEGGSIDVNGRGTLLTTEECLLDTGRQSRNRGHSREEIESALKTWLGVSNIVWLGRGLAGDDTHGHVDDLCRFVNATSLVTVRESNPKDQNYSALEENWERLQGVALEDGSKPSVTALPMPAPLNFRGNRLPASYANFYIANAAVLVPTFNDPNDSVALGILRELIPDRPVIGIHAVDLVWGLGALHCITQQQPLPPFAQR